VNPRKTQAYLFLLLVALAVPAMYLLEGGAAIGGSGRTRDGRLELDVTSEYSHIRVRRTNDYRSLLFVRDSGQEVVETTVNLSKPHILRSGYTRYMFLSYLYRAKQEKVLIVGLGGGAMVHFLRHYDPNVSIDVVEIDPVVVQVADKYFGVRNTEKVKIETADAMKYLQESEAKYDVIYMDAFLKPSADTDSTGVPLKLKTAQYYKMVQQRLNPGGLVAFNINPHAKVGEDIKEIQSAFPQVYVYQLPRSAGYVVFASLSDQRLSFPASKREAGELDRQFKTPYSFETMAAQRTRDR